MKETAGAWPRLRAFLWDYVLIAGYLLLLAVVATTVLWLIPGAGRALQQAGPVAMDALAFVTAVLPVTLYFALQESGPRQATWGKRRVGLRVETVRGERPSRGRALLRAAVKFAPWQLAHTCLFHIPGWPMAPAEPSGWVIAGLIAVQGLVLLYLLLLALRPHRPPYDWAAGTQVVTERRNTKRAEKTQREQGGKKGDTD